MANNFERIDLRQWSVTLRHDGEEVTSETWAVDPFEAALKVARTAEIPLHRVDAAKIFELIRDI